MYKMIWFCFENVKWEIDESIMQDKNIRICWYLIVVLVIEFTGLLWLSQKKIILEYWLIYFFDCCHVRNYKNVIVIY